MFTASTAARALLAVLLLPALSPAHELWIQPDPPSIDSSAFPREVAIRILTGERFHGEELGWDPERCAEMRDFSGGTIRELKGEAGAAPAAYLGIEKPGVHLVSYRSNPAAIEIDARTFNRYLLEHGLSEAWQTRQERGDLERAGRERFTRYCKTILLAPARNESVAGDDRKTARNGSAAGAEDRTAQLVLGHRLEIVPWASRTDVPGTPFQILFENKPLAQATVFASPQNNSQQGLVRAVTDSNGIVTFDLHEPGLWMISLVHMLPCNNCPDADWESCWASFVLSSPVHAFGFVP